ncbi:MAG: TetR/AcrR family transcriptional regulator [Spirochaetia bacterium]
MRQRENRNHILSAALRLFSLKGYYAVGVQEICTESGITKPTLYYYFGNKEGLLRELLISRYRLFHSKLRKAAEYTAHPGDYNLDVLPVLIRLTRSYFEFALGNPDFYRMQLSFMFSPADSVPRRVVSELNTEHYAIVEGMFSRMAAVHLNMAGKEKILTDSFIGAVNAAVLRYEKEGSGLTGEHAEELVKIFMHGIFS